MFSRSKRKLLPFFVLLLSLLMTGLWGGQKAQAYASKYDQETQKNIYYLALGEEYAFWKGYYNPTVSDETVLSIAHVPGESEDPAEGYYVVTASAVGESTVELTRKNDNQTVTYSFVVVESPWDFPRMTHEEMLRFGYLDNLEVGETIDAQKYVSWRAEEGYEFLEGYSEEEDIVSIDASGTITPLKVGTAHIHFIYRYEYDWPTVHTVYELASMRIDVTEDRPGEEYPFYGTQYLELMVGDTIEFNLDSYTGWEYHSYYEDGYPEWTVENPDIVEIVKIEDAMYWEEGNSPTGKITIKGLAPGRAHIYATFHGDFKVSGYDLRAYVLVVNTVEKNPATVDLEITKWWEDEEDNDGIRPTPEEMLDKLKILANGEPYDLSYDEDTQVSWRLDENGNYVYKITALPLYYLGDETTYTVEEDSIPGYELIYTENWKNETEDPLKSSYGMTLVNEHKPETIDLEVSKIWEDDEDRDGIRPRSITVTLLADGKEANTLTLTARNEWKGSFTGLKKYDAGREIVYTIREEETEGYTAAVEGLTITNTHEPEKTSVSVEKKWEDANDKDGLRPGSITLVLLADGKEADRAELKGSGNTWRHSFEDLNVYRDGGIPIVYTVEELKVKGYDTKVETKAAQQVSGVCDECCPKMFVITNTHVPEIIEIPVLKVWNDGHDADGLRPGEVTVTLLADGKEVKRMNLTARQGWSYTFTELPKLKDGKEIVYTVEEKEVEGYTAQVRQLNEEDVTAGFTITNSHEPEVPVELTEVKVDKLWNDKNDVDKKRPDSVTVTLLADGVPAGRAVLRASEGWTYTFKDLAKYNEEGGEIAYTVEEEAVEHYTAEVTGDAKLGFLITNSHTPAEKETKVQVSKHWEDKGYEKERPESVVIRLFANGVEKASLELNEGNSWAGQFAHLPELDEKGQKILYTVQEDPVEGYSSELDQTGGCCGECVNRFTNTYIPKEEPTTEAPTTEAPTTEAPTTEAPTTEAPTTEAPTTEAPTTEAPTTEAPTTEVPATTAPPTEPAKTPTTAAPTTTEAPKGPDTGDEGRMAPYAVLLAGGALTSAWLATRRRKEEN